MSERVTHWWTDSGDERNQGIMIATDVWKEFGYGAIIFIAALAGINQELYEAASIDGASRLQKIWNITLPGIKVTVVLVATLNVADVKAKCECFYFKDGKYIVRMKGASADESLTLDELVAKGLATHKQVLSGSFPTDKGIELLSDAELRAKGVVSIEVLPDGGRSPFYVLTHYSGGRMSAEGLVRQGYAKRVTATAAPDGRLRPEDACKWRINDAELKRRGIISVKQVENGGRLMYEITQSDGKTYLRNIMQMALTYLVIAS